MTASLMNKPRVTEKILEHFRRVAANGGSIGCIPRGIVLNYDYRCNFSCQHCFAGSPQLRNAPPTSPLSLDELKNVFDQANDLGIYEVDIQGGEPLLYPDLMGIIAAIGSDRFYIYVTSNGYLLDESKARQLAQAGITRVTVSVDGLDEDENDTFRGMKGAYRRAWEALEHIRQAGMQPTINFTVTRENVLAPELDELCGIAREKKYHIAFNCATPTGCWQGKTNVMITAQGRDRLQRLREKYPGMLIRDLWNVSDRKQKRVCGCPSVNLCYINPAGDVLPCPYLHIKLGNIREQPLADILEFGFGIRHFREHSDVCLAGENKGFVEEFLSFPGMSIRNPLPARDVFPEKDFLS